MRLVVLTTDTPHHAHFVEQVAARYPVNLVLEETTGVVPPFDTIHPFEGRRDAHEREVWFGGRDARIADFADVSRHENLNNPEVAAELRTLRPDAVVVFGTRRLKPSVIEVCGEKTINLHGGDPEYYRGLDTHLWAVYHGDFENLSTTLHTVNNELDDGRIIASLPVPLHCGMELHEFRLANTEICIRLTLQALEHFERRGRFVCRPQRTKGRYYSFMPSVLKEICVCKFKQYTDTISYD